MAINKQKKRWALITLTSSLVASALVITAASCYQQKDGNKQTKTDLNLMNKETKVDVSLRSASITKKNNNYALLLGITNSNNKYVSAKLTETTNSTKTIVSPFALVSAGTVEVNFNNLDETKTYKLTTINISDDANGSNPKEIRLSDAIQSTLSIQKEQQAIQETPKTEVNKELKTKSENNNTELKEVVKDKEKTKLQEEKKEEKVKETQAQTIEEKNNIKDSVKVEIKDVKPIQNEPQKVENKKEEKETKEEVKSEYNLPAITFPNQQTTIKATKAANGKLNSYEFDAIFNSKLLNNYLIVHFTSNTNQITSDLLKLDSLNSKIVISNLPQNTNKLTLSSINVYSDQQIKNLKETINLLETPLVVEFPDLSSSMLSQNEMKEEKAKEILQSDEQNSEPSEQKTVDQSKKEIMNLDSLKPIVIKFPEDEKKIIYKKGGKWMLDLIIENADGLDVYAQIKRGTSTFLGTNKASVSNGKVSLEIKSTFGSNVRSGRKYTLARVDITKSDGTVQEIRNFGEGVDNKEITAN